jgi:hypothetical protein
MPPIRFRSRHLHATFYNQLKTSLDTLGWVNPPVNFGTAPLVFMDYQPDERAVQIKQNTVAVSLGDFDADLDEELGASGGGLRSAEYNVYIDVYMQEQALSQALCDDVRDIYTDFQMDLIDQVTQAPIYGALIQVDTVIGPQKPSIGVDAFKRYWRTMRLDAVLYFQS